MIVDNSSNSHTTQLSAYDMWMCGDKAKNYFKFINLATKEAADKTFGGRLELTLCFRQALENQEELLPTMISAFEHTTVQPTLARSESIRCQTAFSCCFSWLGLELVCLSRPDTFSIWQGISSYADKSSYTASDVLLVPYALKYNSNGHLGLSVALSQSDLRAIYHKDYNAVFSPSRRVPSNATPSRVTHLLEVSFGFCGFRSF
ncbi:hypothetical protein BCR42DRAFT_215760 [Absidia repens]|uniref:Uncharacterized protein n=1 Tax=Absidia repens TaxID=90262 RepID=A0A1X2HH38_9FUNG|nr:hypothetical protein BCR42DRAFT_215760 [Absidia repens]